MLLRREGWAVNAKRIYRLYTEDGLTVRTKVRRKIARRQRMLLLRATRPNQRWRVEFRRVTGQPLKRKPATPRADKFGYQVRPMRRQSVPHHQQLPRRDDATGGRGSPPPEGRGWLWDRAGSKSSTR